MEIINYIFKDIGCDNGWWNHFMPGSMYWLFCFIVMQYGLLYTMDKHNRFKTLKKLPIDILCFWVFEFVCSFIGVICVPYYIGKCIYKYLNNEKN